MRILVTGGAGYIGSHCSKEFSRRGWEVVVYDNLSRGWRDFVKWGRLIEGDILDQNAVNQAIADTQPDIVAHFAALAYVGESVTSPAEYYRTNVCGAMNLLDAMRAHAVDKMLFSSTCATYGEPRYLPIDEHHPQVPINPYGSTKLMVEHMLKDYERAYGIRHVALRYFNAAGADPDGDIGERHQPETHAIPLAIAAATEDGEEFTIFGENYDTHDGTAIRDYIHVMDLADAHARSIDYLIEGGASEAFNLGTGMGTSVFEIISAVEQVANMPLAKRMAARREGDPAALTATPDKAEAVLGWRPKYVGITNAVADAWRWHQLDTAPQH